MTLRSRATPAAYGKPTELIERLKALPPVKHGAFAGPSVVESSYLQQRYEALRCALTRPCVVRHEEPGELTSTANMRGATRQAVMAKAAGVKSKRAMGERIAARFVCEVRDSHRATEARLIHGASFAVVVITRIAPRLLDSDNLESACKALRDGIAAGLGIDDRSPLVRYVVSQQQGEPRQHLIRAELFIEPTQGEAQP